MQLAMGTGMREGPAAAHCMAQLLQPAAIQERLPAAPCRASIRAMGARSGFSERDPPSFHQGAGCTFALNASVEAWSLLQEKSGL